MLLLPPTIIATMPTRKSKLQAIANNGSGTLVPPSTTVSLPKSPPKNIQQLASPPAKILQTFPPADTLYPPCGRHPSNPMMILFHKKNRSTSHPSCNTKMTKNLSSCFNSVGRLSDKTLSTRGPSPTPAKGDSFSIFNPSPSTALMSSLTQGSLTIESSIIGKKKPSPSCSRSISCLNTRHSNSCWRKKLHLTDVLHTDEFPPHAASGFPKSSDSESIKLGNNSLPYVTASAAHCVDHEAKKASDEKVADAGRWASDLVEVRRQKERFTAMEAWLISLSNSITEDLDMGDCEEEDAIRRSTKKKAGTTSSVTPSAGYSSPTRVSSGSKKQNQVSSHATHYATGSCRSSTPCNNADTLQFFAPSGNSEKALAEAVTLSQRLASCTPTPSAPENIEIIENKENDDKVDGHPGNFLGGKSDGKPKLGHTMRPASHLWHSRGQPLLSLPPPSNCLLSILPALLLSSSTPSQAWMVPPTLILISSKALIRLVLLWVPISSQCL
jgi:hypothetical protein